MKSFTVGQLRKTTRTSNPMVPVTACRGSMPTMIDTPADESSAHATTPGCAPATITTAAPTTLTHRTAVSTGLLPVWNAAGLRNIHHRFPRYTRGQAIGTPDRVSQSPRMCTTAPTPTVNPINHGAPPSDRTAPAVARAAAPSAAISPCLTVPHALRVRATVASPMDAIPSTTNPIPRGMDADNPHATNPNTIVAGMVWVKYR